ncbi:alpha-L-rhamnosidase [Aequitasia blattaphilus]|uniref:alpha-L-rhamnosidase n=1 Tax=Aequitasia blattaphilus TaxID=2949332 RepID=A0ABT1EEF2_9FIRM|nr:alpha-L-rhamnosidase [Aequitasia blattaphilus]MCP1103221.1 glycoside hydrolase family 78 protein [Aequitasia blattaphilus]MCR8615861.1 glycoside hydrolase family 78 protein [Aequitasia blattaphilus]
MLKISRFTVESLSSGCVTDNEKPRFSYFVESDKQEVVIKNATLSMSNGWQKNTVEQIGVTYDGEGLDAFHQYTVKLEVSNNYNETAVAELTFETGRMLSEWKSKWITDGAYHFKEAKVSPKTMTFRKNINCSKEIRCAKIYVTAFGIYELMLNGEKVGEDYFAPGFTSYRNQLQYQTYDVTGQLQEKNCLVVVVGGGWAVGSFTYKRRNRVYAKRQALLAELRIEYCDGTKEIVGTDETWSVTEEGNFRETEFYNGEVYDATVDLDQIQWRKAEQEQIKISPKIMAQYGVPVRAKEQFEPICCTHTKGGMLLYDFGQNFAGVISAEIRGKKGQKITFRHAEILMDGKLYTEPLRTAKQEAVYICEEGMQQYSPRMTYMGFRYVEVTGIEEQDLRITAIALYSDMEENGKFSCSNKLLNQLQSNICWGAKSNFVDIPTDCPQRDERMGWTGDIALFSSTATYNFNMGRFLEKWLLDVKAEQTRGGGIPVTVPLVRVPLQWEIMIPMAVDHWGDACILVPWAEYRARGDKNLLKKMYPTMKRYMKACKFWAQLFSFGKHRRIWRLLHHYGDWCAPEVSMWGWMGRGKWTATACLAYSSGIVAQIAEILGEEKDAKEYAALSKETGDAYRSILMKEDCSVKKEFQTAYVLPLYYEMLSTSDKKQTAKHLSRMIRENNYHIGTGFPGTPYVLFALADNGFAEDAFRMLLTDTCPSWLYEAKVGGTTIWERWDALREDGTCNTGEGDGTGGMVSFNHYASGAVGDFLYRRIAGIEPLEGGYKRFQIKPLMGGKISWAKGEVLTAYGKVSSSWKIENHIFCIDIEVPVGATCQLVMPSGEQQLLASGSYHFEEEERNRENEHESNI